MNLSKAQLHEKCFAAIEAVGWTFMRASSHTPLDIQVFRTGDAVSIPIRIYIWNCTHGGATRAPDEFRIQLTSTPVSAVDGPTVLLGWHAGYGVFVGWDVATHEGQDSGSPSAQVKETLLIEANKNHFAASKKSNDELVVAFKPEFLLTYAFNAVGLHSGRVSTDELRILNAGSFTKTELAKLPPKRRQVVQHVIRWYRATDFRRRVLSAYNHQCAMCGLQLNLVDAAHIIPVADARSSDDTNNGVALCRLHHSAFDQNLVSIDDKFRILVSQAEARRLTAAGLDAGLAEFRSGLLSALRMPADKRDRPTGAVLRIARSARGF